jgi:hypothetical protein
MLVLDKGKWKYEHVKQEFAKHFLVAKPTYYFPFV